MFEHPLRRFVPRGIFRPELIFTLCACDGANAAMDAAVSTDTQQHPDGAISDVYLDTWSRADASAGFDGDVIDAVLDAGMDTITDAGTIPDAGTRTPVETHGQLHVCGTHLCDEHDATVQLHGMSTHGVQWYGWENCISEDSLDVLADDWRADIMRVSLYVQEGGYESDPERFTQEVDTILEQLFARGLYTIIDWHQLSPGDPWDNIGG